MLKNSLSTPKLLYLLKTSSERDDNRLLRQFDDTLQTDLINVSFTLLSCNHLWRYEGFESTE